MCLNIDVAIFYNFIYFVLTLSLLLDNEQFTNNDCSSHNPATPNIKGPCPCPLMSVLNPSNTEATSVRSTRTERVMKTTATLAYWYSLESPH